MMLPLSWIHILWTPLHHQKHQVSMVMIDFRSFLKNSFFFLENSITRYRHPRPFLSKTGCGVFLPCATPCWHGASMDPRLVSQT